MVFFIKDLVSPKDCKKIIEKFEKSKDKRPGTSLMPDASLEVNTDKISVELLIPNDGSWEGLQERLHRNVEICLQEIIKLAPALKVKPIQWASYKIKKYIKNKGHFKWHFDNLGKGASNRQLAIVIYLNDVEEGGETNFYFQNLGVKPTAGMAIIFPPFWTHMHQGTTPKSNHKYIITSFVEFDLEAA